MKTSIGLMGVIGFLLLAAKPASATTIDFTGAYEVVNWDATLNGGTISTAGAPFSIWLTSADNGGGAKSQDFEFLAFEPATVSFHWDYLTTEIFPSFDPFGWLLNGVFTPVTANVGAAQAGDVAFFVLPGQTFGFRAHSTDSVSGPATTTVSNFQVDPVPEPGTLLLLGTGLAAALRSRSRKRRA
jgi:hypothetical protein